MNEIETPFKIGSTYPDGKGVEWVVYAYDDDDDFHPVCGYKKDTPHMVEKWSLQGNCGTHPGDNLIPPTPEMKKAPLGPEDFPPGTVVQREGWGHCYKQIDVLDNSIQINEQYYSYKELVNDDIQRLLPGTTEWLPCWKLVPAV